MKKGFTFGREYWSTCKHCRVEFKVSAPVYAAGARRGKIFCGKPCMFAWRLTEASQHEKFWIKVNKNAAGGCWLFTGCIGHEGYGSVATGHKYRKVQHQAHRYSWQINRGQIPADKLVLHKCDVRACVNPDHLYLGNRHDNARDAVERGRHHRKGRPLLWPELRYKHERIKQRNSKRRSTPPAAGESK